MELLLLGPSALWVVSLVDARAQAEYLLVRGGSSRPAERCWEVVAFPSHSQSAWRHQGMEQAFTDASSKCTLVLALSHAEAGQSSEFDQKVPRG